MPIARESLNSDGQTFPNGETSETYKGQMFWLSVDNQNLSPEVSHAKTSLLQVKGLDSKENEVDFGRKCSDWFARYDPNTHSLKMSQLSFIQDSIESYATLPQSGTMQDGKLFRLPLLEALIGETELGLLPTPTASDMTCGETIGKNDTFYKTKTGMPRKVNQNGKDGSVGLGRLVQMWGTPMAQTSSKIDSPGERKRDSPHLETIVKERYGIPINKRVRLHPHFLEWLMGLPREWTGEQCVETAKSFRSSNMSVKK